MSGSRDPGGAADDDRRPRVLLALTGAAYEEALLGSLAGPDARMVVARRCLDLVDLLAAATAGLAPAAVVWPGLHGLDRETVARLAATGVVACGVAEGADADRLLGLGVAAVVGPPAGPDRQPGDVVRALAAAVRGGLRAQPDGRGYSAPQPPWATPAGAAAPLDGSAAAAGHPPVDPTTATETPCGRLVAVWGPVGAPGRTTVALALADELALLGCAVVLADADTYGPSVAQRLGMLDEASGVAEAVRRAGRGPLAPADLARVARTLPSGVRVLTGLTRADRWPELGPASLAAVWSAATAVSDVTVVDCGFSVEDDEELAYDTLAPRRNAATLVTLDRADVVVAVGSGDPVGVQRLVRGLADLRERWPAARPRVVVTQVRRSAAGRDPGGQILQVLRRHAGVDDPVLVPDDRPAFDQALAASRPLAQVAPRSPARAVLRSLAVDLARAPAAR